MSLMSDVLEAMECTRIVAVVRRDQYDQAVEVTRALAAGGILVIEFTHTGRGVDAPAYLQVGAIAVGIGWNLVAPQAVARGDWAQITASGH
jgi:2-keto-3-deoxy-6-phosphogluconate aldolase